MALTRIDKFDELNPSDLAGAGYVLGSAGTVPVTTSGVGRYSGNRIAVTYDYNTLGTAFGSDGVSAPLVSAGSFITWGADWQVVTANAVNAVVTFSSGVSTNSTVGMVVYDPDAQQFWLTQGDTIRLTWAYSPAVAAASWYHVEVQYSHASGTWAMRVDGVLLVGGGVFLLTAQPTYWKIGDPVGSGTPMNSLGESSAVLEAVSRTTYWDNIYTRNDLTFLGPCQVTSRVPTSDSATEEDWTPSSGTDSWAMLDEAKQDGDTTTISSAAVGAITRVKSSTSIGTPATVHGMSVRSVYRKTDATARTIRNQILSNLTVALGATVNCQTTYAATADVWETNPATSTAWDKATVEAVEFGVEVVS